VNRITGLLHKIKLYKFLILIIILAFGIRLGIIFGTCISTPYTGMLSHYLLSPYSGETALHGEGARNLVEGRGFVADENYVGIILGLQQGYKLIDLQDIPPPEEEHFSPIYQFTPGTSFLLAGTFWVFGEYRYIYLRVIQAIIDSFGCLLIFLIGRELFSKRIGLISAFLYSIWVPIAYLSTWVLHDALMPFITLLSLYFFIVAIRTGGNKFYILSAISVGIGCYFQPTIMLLPLIFGLVLFLHEFHRADLKKHVFKAIKVTVIMMAVLILFISPWVVRNYNILGTVTYAMRGPGLWVTIWEGFGEFGENPAGAALDDTITYEQAKSWGYEGKIFTPEYNDFFKPKVLDAIKEHPSWWLSLLARRIPSSLGYSSELGVYFCEFISAVLKSPFNIVLCRGLGAMFTITPILLSLFAVWIMRRRWKTLLLVALLPVYFSLVHIFFFSSSYKSIAPGTVGYIILSAVALDYIYGMIKGSREAKKLATPPN